MNHEQPTGEGKQTMPPRPSGQHDERLPKCIEAFATLNTTLAGFVAEMKGMRAEVRDSSKAQAGTAESVKGLWHEVREELRPAVRAIATAMKGDLNHHEGNCPARRGAMRKAEGQSSTSIPTGEGLQINQDERTGAITIARRKIIRNTPNGHYEIPRPVLWIGGLIGSAIAASGYFLEFLKSLGN